MCKRYCSLFVFCILFLTVSGQGQEQDGSKNIEEETAAFTPARTIEPPLDPGYFDTPTWVMTRSLLVPGWGQIHNRAWLKALGVIAIEGAMIERLLFEKDRVHYYRDLRQRRPEEADYYQMKEDRHKGHRRDFIWWTSLFVFLSMWDAFVDAHLRYFDVELQTSPEIFQVPADPAEPAATDETELSLRLSFGIGK